MAEFDLLVIGEINVDLLVRGGEVWPELGQEKIVEDATLTIGSSSAIFACQAAKLGLTTAFIGKVGDDEFGRYMMQEVEAQGVETKYVIIDRQVKTGVTISLYTPQDRALLTYLGSIASLCPQEVDPGILRNARHLHVSSYFLQGGLREGLAALFARAKEAGLSISFDTGWDPDERWNGALKATLDRVDLFMPNKEEALNITQAPHVEAALEALARDIPLVVIKLGAQGAVARKGGVLVRQQPPTVQVVDTTGAGDSFDAGFVYGYLKGLSLSQSLQVACLCGALSTRMQGGTAGQPTIEEIEALLEGQ